MVLCDFYVAPGTYLRLRANTFDTAAILRNGGTKTANNCSLASRTLLILLERNGVATLGSSGSLLLRENLRRVALIEIAPRAILLQYSASCNIHH